MSDKASPSCSARSVRAISMKRKYAMLDTTPPQSVSKNITCTSVRIDGRSKVIIWRLSRTLLQDRQHSIGHFPRRYSFHTPKINRAFAQETRTAFHVMPDDDMPVPERAGEARLG